MQAETFYVSVGTRGTSQPSTRFGRDLDTNEALKTLKLARQQGYQTIGLYRHSDDSMVPWVPMGRTGVSVPSFLAREITRVGRWSYVEIDESEVPKEVRFSAPQDARGQMVDWSYGDVDQRSEGGPGDRYARREDRAAQTAQFFLLVNA